MFFFFLIKLDGEGRMGIFTAQLNYLAKRSIEDTEQVSKRCQESRSILKHFSLFLGLQMFSQEGDDILCDFPFRNHGEAFGDAEDVMQATVSYTVKQTSNVGFYDL